MGDTPGMMCWTLVVFGIQRGLWNIRPPVYNFGCLLQYFTIVHQLEVGRIYPVIITTDSSLPYLPVFGGGAMVREGYGL